MAAPALQGAPAGPSARGAAVRSSAPPLREAPARTAASVLETRPDPVGPELAKRVRGHPASAAGLRITTTVPARALVRGGTDLVGAGEGGSVQGAVALADVAQRPVDR